MKKYKLIILLAVFLSLFFSLFSCNTNAEEGIYYQIVNSTKSSQLRVDQYLGEYNTEHYIISAGKLYRISGSGNVQVTKPAESGIIAYAYMNTDDKFIYFICNEKTDNPSTHMYKYDLDDKTVTLHSDTDSFRAIYENGYALGVNGFYKVTNSGVERIKAKGGSVDLSIPPNDVKRVFISDTALAFSTSDTVYIIDGNSVVSTTSTLSGTLTGFQKLSNDYYLVFIDKAAYKVDNNSTEGAVKVLNLDLSPNSRSGYHTAIFGTNKVLIKASSSFIIIEDSTASNYKTKTSDLEFLNNLTQIDPIYVDKSINPNMIVFATNQNGIYLINVESKSKEQIL